MITSCIIVVIPQFNEYSVQDSNNVQNAATGRNRRRANSDVMQHLFVQHQANILTGSYDVPIDAINRNCSTDEDLYCDPPCEETDLKQQLKKLEVLKDDIK